MKIVKFLAGTLIGAAVGAAVAVLMAPSSGEELRNQIEQRAKTLQDEINMAAQTRRIELEAQLDELRKPQKPEAAAPVAES